MTSEEWETVWFGRKVYNPVSDKFGIVTGWEQHSLEGRLSLRIEWEHLGPHDIRQCMRVPWQEKLELPIDAMKLYEELRNG